MLKLISKSLLVGSVLFVCLLSSTANCFAQQIDATWLKNEQRRAGQLVARSNYGFVRTKSDGRKYAEALWRADYYSKINRMRINVYIFSNREQAQKYGVDFFSGTRKQEGEDRARGGDFLRYGYLYNEGILFLVTGHDDDKITRLLSLLARKDIK